LVNLAATAGWLIAQIDPQRRNRGPACDLVIGSRPARCDWIKAVHRYAANMAAQKFLAFGQNKRLDRYERYRSAQ
jgi:hypothetical protein